MSDLEIIHCDPISVSKRRYVARIPVGRWLAVRNDITVLHRDGWKHKGIIAYLKSQRGMIVTPGQLGSKMSEWRLFTYQTTNRCSTIPLSITEPSLQNDRLISDPGGVSRDIRINNLTYQLSDARFQNLPPLYSANPTGGLVPDWSAFLLRAAKGDAQSMKAICILTKSQRFKRTEPDLQLYQNIIEGVRIELSSPDTLSLDISVMVFYSILALAIQTGFMNGATRSPRTHVMGDTKKVPAYSGGTTNASMSHHKSQNESGIHLNAAGHMLGRINAQTQQEQGRQGMLQQLINFFNVANYLLALSGCEQSEGAAWPLLMYHLIVQ